jgi:flagellar secretion chaperone FliS
MSIGKRAVSSYGEVGVHGSLVEADGVDLIQMLFDGLMDSLVSAEGHIQRRDIPGKSACIARASRIVFGLQSSLDMEKGGELASNLSELYSYVNRRLVHVNAENDLETLAEVRGLMNEIRSAWRSVRDAVPTRAMAAAA